MYWYEGKSTLMELKLTGFAKRHNQYFLATVSFEACSILDHLFLMMFSV